jgi:UDP-N-acetylmuramoyl-tripeptide--D-alanyl-D-alanine ligase
VGTAIPVNQAVFTLDELRSITGGVLEHGEGDARVAGISTDTRHLVAGNAFVALRGETFDGHDHAQAAIRAGASALILGRSIGQTNGTALLRVDDTLQALGRIAREHRRRWAAQVQARGGMGRVVAVTGSAGKTTTCRAVAAVLESLAPGSVHASVGNLNNAVGIPIVLLGLRSTHDLAVVEIGTSHPGEIAYGSALAEPDVGVLTLVTAAHTEGLGGIDGVATEKGALLEALEPTGVCVVNADDARVMAQLSRSRARRVVRFGRGGGADIRALEATALGLEGQRVQFELRRSTGAQSLEVRVPLLGDAGVYAAGAALAVAMALVGDDLDLTGPAAALRGVRAEAGRLRPRTLHTGAVLVDDAYNANPASMADSIRVAGMLAAQLGRSLALVLGEMRELGPASLVEHAKVGRQVASSGAAWVVAVAGDASLVARQAAEAGIDAEFGASADDAIELVRRRLSPHDVVLVKGSRGVALDRVIRALESREEESLS